VTCPSMDRPKPTFYNAKSAEDYDRDGLAQTETE